MSQVERSLLPIDEAKPKESETAYLAMGCFWGSDALFGIQKGVISTTVGYAGGEEEDPTYYNLGGHAETVRVVYDPKIISYEKILDIFWVGHSAEVPPYSCQYMSAVFTADEKQEETALRKKKELEELSGEMIYTEILPLDTFYVAEGYHQKYRLRQAKEIEAEFKQAYPDEKDFILSTAAARVNGYLAGLGTSYQFRNEKKLLGLSPVAVKLIKDMHSNLSIKEKD